MSNFEKLIFFVGVSSWLCSLLIFISRTNITNIQITQISSNITIFKVPEATGWKKLDLNPEKSTLVYIHIPKTAGSSFKKRIDKINTKYEFYPNSRTQSWNSPGCRKLTKFGGTHCGYSEIKSCIDSHQATLNYSRIQNIKYFSVIRDPVERVISEYFWWKDKEAFAWSDSLKNSARKGNFTEWILNPENSAHNRQFKSFVNFEDIGHPKNYSQDCLNIRGNWWVKYWDRKNEMVSENELIFNVFENIEQRFGFVGVLEDMNESLKLLQFIMNGNDGELKTVEKHDKSKLLHKSIKSKVSVFQRRLIWERNKLDIKLYDFVKKKCSLTKINL